MLTKMLRRTVVADKTVALVCQIICTITGGLVLVFGIRKLANLELNEDQLFAATIGTLLLAGIFIVLAFLCHNWRRTAS